ncbi:AraC family transcriptional regulator [Paucilactobacillus kaifaensis]|uniref:AraC family transcriptional regulator n=1 Tax=Paucilactobacillus kaifaensis TaxID=2559921 RepID=UPI0010F8BFC1|nr:AraC family transcriptional regulator [Paucilactobacillus kaifaensis]
MILRDNQLVTLWMSGKGYSKDFKVKQHRHDFYQLQYLITGEENISINQQKYILKPNNIALMDSNVYHEYSFNKNAKLIDIKFNLDNELRHFLSNLFLKPVFPVNDAFLRNSFSQLVEQAVNYQTSENSELLLDLDTQVKLLLLQLLHSSRKTTTVSGNSMNTSIFSEILQDDSFPMLDFLEQNYDQQITLDDLMEKFHYSKGQIIKMFSDTLHQTPMQVLQKIRIEHSIYLLKNTNYSIGKIANMVGFSDNYFTKIFFKYEHQVPNKYRITAKKASEDIILNRSFDIATQP